MKKLLLILLLPTLCFAQSRINVNQLPTGAGTYVSQWGDSDNGIDSAIAHAGVNGTVFFTLNKTYLQTRTHTPLAGQRWVGNGATLQRQTETVVTTTATFASTVNAITVSSVPSTWTIGSQIQIFPSQSSVGASQILTISNISGTTITLSSQLGAALYNNASSYASGCSVWRVWHQIDDATSVHNNCAIEDLKFDGNQTTSCPNVYWGANNAIYARAPQVIIYHCNFVNMGNDNVVGHGLTVINCTGSSMNNSFIHLSADFTVSPATYPSFIYGNVTNNTNQIASASGSQHSEGVITLSFTSGYVHIFQNWFKGGLDAVLGTISMATVSQSGATRYMEFNNNQCFNFTGVIKGFSADNTALIKPGIINITGNIFSNCGTTSPFPATLNAQWAFIDKIVWFNNQLSDGTTVTIPAEVFTTDAIANTNGTSNIQTGTSFNIDGSGTMNNAVIGGTIGIGSALSSSNQAALQINGSSNINYRSNFNGNTATLTANYAYANVLFPRVPVTTAPSGTHPVLTNVAISPFTATSGGATSPIAASLYIDGDPTGGSANYSLYIGGSGKALIAGNVNAASFTGSATANNPVFQSSSTFGTSNFSSVAVSGTTQSASTLQFGGSNLMLRALFNGSTALTPAAGIPATNVILGGTAGVTLPSSGTTPLVSQMIIKDVAVTNASSITATNKSLLYIEAPAAVPSSATTTLYSAHFAGAGRVDGGIVTNGAITTAAWGTSGINFNAVAQTFTDNSSVAGATVTNAMVNSWGAPTITASLATSGSKVTYTNAATAYIAAGPSLGTNTLGTNGAGLWIAGPSTGFTNNYSLFVGSGLSVFNGSLVATATIATSTTTTAANFFANVTNVITGNQTDSKLLFGGATTVQGRAWFTGNGNSTTLGTGNSYFNTQIGQATVATAGSGTHAWLVNGLVNSLGTVTSNGATVTNTASLYVGSASAAGTNNYALYVNGVSATTHLIGITSAPTIAAGTGAGTSPTVAVAGNDMAQKVTITTGTSPSTSATVATVTFNVAYGAAPKVILTPVNSAAAALNGTAQVYVDDASAATGSYVIKVGSGGLAASTTYLFYAQVIQ